MISAKEGFKGEFFNADFTRAVEGLEAHCFTTPVKKFNAEEVKRKNIKEITTIY